MVIGGTQWNIVRAISEHGKEGGNWRGDKNRFIRIASENNILSELRPRFSHDASELRPRIPSDASELRPQFCYNRSELRPRYTYFQLNFYWRSSVTYKNDMVINMHIR